MDVVSSREDPSSSPWRRGVPASFLFHMDILQRFCIHFHFINIFIQFQSLSGKLYCQIKRPDSLSHSLKLVKLVTIKTPWTYYKCKCSGKCCWPPCGSAEVWGRLAANTSVYNGDTQQARRWVNRLSWLNQTNQHNVWVVFKAVEDYYVHKVWLQHWFFKDGLGQAYTGSNQGAYVFHVLLSRYFSKTNTVTQ